MNSSTARASSASNSTPRARFIVSGLAALGLTIGAASLALGGDEDAELAAKDGRQGKGGQAMSVAKRRSLLASATKDGALCSFAPGTRMAYAVHSETEVEIDFSGLEQKIDVGGQGQAQVAASEAESHHVERDWLLELEAIAVEEDGASVLAARIGDRGTSIRASGDAVDAPTSALGNTFLIRVDPRCSIREFGWRTEGDLDAAREQQVMAAGLGFVAPVDAGEPANYGGTAFDATGRYNAAFHYDEQGTVHGEAQSYAIGTGAVTRGAPISLEVLSSTIEARLAPGTWFERLSNERDLAMELNGREFGTHFRSTKAEQTALGGFAPRVDLDDGGWSWGMLQAEDEPASEQFDEALVAMPIDDVLARYRELVEKGSPSEYGALLREWLRANPEGAQSLASLLREGAFADEQVARAGIFYALGGANTEQAQAVLVGFLGADELVRHQVAAAHALALVDKPTAEMVELLGAASMREGMHPVDQGSMALALGSLARSSTEHDPEVAAMAREEIRGWLSEPVEGRGVASSILAAGNAGHDTLAADIAPYLDDEDPKIRRHATHALRQMSPEEAMPRLEGSALDEDRVVRTSAFETATTVMRSHDQAAPETLIEAAAAALPEAGAAEERAALSLLGEAAKRGSERAGALLQERLHEQLAGPRDPTRLAALGRQLPGSWKASN